MLMANAERACCLVNPNLTTNGRLKVPLIVASLEGGQWRCQNVAVNTTGSTKSVDFNSPYFSIPETACLEQRRAGLCPRGLDPKAAAEIILQSTAA